MTTNGSRTADFIILGAGVMGTSIAFHLARRKAGKIIILDKDHVGHGGSGRSSALIRMHYSFPAEVQMALLSLRVFEQWHEITGEPSIFQKTGFVRIVHAHETERLKRNVKMQREFGVKVEMISRHQLKELEPDWWVEDVELAAYEPDSGYGDGAAVASDFLNCARDLGACYFAKTEAMALVVEGGRVSGVKTNHAEILAPRVIAATGPWTRPLFEKTSYTVPIETEYHQVAILKKPADMRSARACIDSGSQTYFRPDGHDKFLVGDFYGKRPVDPDNFPQRCSEESLEGLIERACRRLPKLEHAEVVRGVTGVYDMTPDSRPLLGEVPGVEGLYLCAGFSGMGFKISPAIGLVMAELLLEGRAHTIDISAFRPDRFAEGRLIKAEYEYVDD